MRYLSLVLLLALLEGLGGKHKPGLFTGAVEPQFYPATMYIDYIRVWRTDNTP